MLKKIGYLISIFVLVSSAAWAEVGIEATIQPSRVMVGDSVTLTITVKGTAANIKTPQLPDLPNVRAYSEGHSQEISFINGVMSAQHIFSYVLVPTSPGRQNLGQIEINIDGKVYKTGVLEVDVFDGSGAGQSTAQTSVSSNPPTVVPPSSNAFPPEFQAGQEVFVRAWADKQEAYVNEGISLTYTVYTRVSATYKGFDKEPVTTGFWVEEIPLAKSVNRQEKDIGGYRYIVADVRTLVLFPSEAGNFTIDPGVLKIDAEIPTGPGSGGMFATDLFGRRRFYNTPSMLVQVVPRLFQTQPIPITVKPLPEEGRPDDFKGAVGKYALGASVDKATIEEGQPVTHKLSLSGEGNLNTVELPKLPELDYFKSYDSSSSLNLDKSKFYVHGEKTLETVLIPKKAGTFTVPPVSFSFFNPGAQKYETLTAKPLTVTVRPTSEENKQAPFVAGPTVTAPKEVSLIGEDIRHIKNSTDPFVPETAPWLSKRSFWLLNAGIFLSAWLALILKWLADRASIDTGGMRLKRSHRLASRRLKEARSHLKKGSATEFYESLARGVYGYFADKLNLQPGAVDLQSIEQHLRGKISEEEMVSIRETFDEINRGRFGRADVSNENMQRFYEKCEEMISGMQGKRL